MIFLFEEKKLFVLKLFRVLCYWVIHRKSTVIKDITVICGYDSNCFFKILIVPCGSIKITFGLIFKFTLSTTVETAK